jgi:hypothetical protein
VHDLTDYCLGAILAHQSLHILRYDLTFGEISRNETLGSIMFERFYESSEIILLVYYDGLVGAHQSVGMLR